MLTGFTAIPFYLLGLWKRSFLYAGLVFQSAYVVSRGLELGRLPLVGPHDTLIFVSASIVAFFLFRLRFGRFIFAPDHFRGRLFILFPHKDPDLTHLSDIHRIGSHLQ